MKHVLITGASDGLGKVIAQKLIESDFEVTILAKEKSKTATVAEELGCNFVVADVSDYKSLQAVVSQTGEIDILINNAGIWLQGPFDESDIEKMNRVMNVNAMGMMYAAHAVIPQMKKRKSGRIINVMSQAGLAAKADRVPYNVSKWAGTGLTKSLQQELKPFGISVVGFYPGALNNEAIFKKAGNPRDMSKGLDLNVAAEAVVYVCCLPMDVNVPEFGIESLNY